MARDRVAAMRAQQQASYSDRWSHPSHEGAGYPQPHPPQNIYVRPDCRPTTVHGQPGIQCTPHESGARWSYPSPQGIGRPDMYQVPNPYPHHNGHYDDHYNISAVRRSAPSVGYPQEDMSTFYSEIGFIQDNLRTFNDNISRISDLHSRSLNSMDLASSRRITHQLEGLVDETSSFSNLLKVRIKNLHSMDVSGREGQIRKQQTGLVKHKFIEAIQNYQQVEQAYRAKCKQRMERQYRVVNPDATSEEIKAVVDDDQSGQIFTQMLQSSNRYGACRAAFREVQERHDDVRKIERTLAELAQLFNDMHILVMRDGEAIDGIQAMAMVIEKHAEIGLQHTERAVEIARGVRSKKWLCVGIVFIIVVCFIIAIGVLANQLNNNNKN